MKLTRIIRAIIEDQEGSSVADQFYAVFENCESFDEQNFNALRYIYFVLKNELLNSPCFTMEAKNEIHDYINLLDKYFETATV